MSRAARSGEPSRSGMAGAVTFGFGVTVAMWAVGYFGRLPGVMLPSPLLLALLLVCLFAGGFVLGRRTGMGARWGAVAGCVTGLLNLMVLGSFLGGDHPGTVVPATAVWLPGSILAAAALAAAGAALGSRRPVARQVAPDWCSAFSRVAVAAALLLLGVGGLVTSTGTGLAVVDWPNSFGYNMFLYPFSRMTGGIYYEHAHRLFGALVGLTTVALAVMLQRREPRPWVRRLGWVAVVMVVVQGILGGLRVTGGFTLSTATEAMRPSLVLAMFHGVLGQVFFATLVALASFTAPTWRSELRAMPRESARADRAIAIVLVLAMIGQLVLGAAQRHFSALLFGHILLGVALVAPLAFHVGFRAWGLNDGAPLLQRLGIFLVVAISLQVLLGFGAYVARGASAGLTAQSGLAIGVRTAHQWFGAVLLATGVLQLCWTFRLIVPARQDASAAVPGPERSAAADRVY